MSKEACRLTEWIAWDSDWFLAQITQAESMQSILLALRN